MNSFEIQSYSDLTGLLIRIRSELVERLLAVNMIPYMLKSILVMRHDIDILYEIHTASGLFTTKYRVFSITLKNQCNKHHNPHIATNDRFYCSVLSPQNCCILSNCNVG